MLFAQIPEQAIKQLKGFRFQLYSIVQLEMFKSGESVCKLTNQELKDAYGLNYDSLTRYRKEMLADGWLVEVVGGIATKSFADAPEAETPATDEKSVTENGTDNLSVQSPEILTNYQETQTGFNNTDEKSVNEETTLINYQSGTDKKSGTLIAKRINNSQEDLQEDSLSPRERETLDFDAASEIVGGVTETEETPEQIFYDRIESHLKTAMNTPFELPDAREWQQAIEWAYCNEKSAEDAIEAYDLLAEIKARGRHPWTITPKLWKRNIPKIETLRIELETLKNGGNQLNGSGQKPNQSNGHRETDAERREREASERREFDRASREFLESQGIVQTGGL